ncbi:MAG: MerR family transcriptional regulator [Gammaproteobacteria bacterium]
MRIGELAKHAGVRVETVRYYERSRLLPPPPRNAAGYRQYGELDLQRLCFLRGCRDLGFSISEIRDLLNLMKRRGRSCATVTRLATRHLTEVQAKVSNLMRVEKALQELVDSCAGGPIRDCRILDIIGRAGGVTERGPAASAY